MKTTTTREPRLHQPRRSTAGRQARGLRMALLPAAAALMLCLPVGASTPSPVDPYGAFCSNNPDLCTSSKSVQASAKAYNEFCANNSDLCTVTARGGGRFLVGSLALDHRDYDVFKLRRGVPNLPARLGRFLSHHQFGAHPMHLMRIGAPGAEKPIVRVDQDTYVDLSDIVNDYDEAFFSSGPAGRPLAGR